MDRYRFRFRVWSKGDRRMFDSGASPSDLARFFEDHALALQHDSAVLMQATGLLDSVGHDIFEGDIIRFTFPDEPKLYRVYWDDFACFSATQCCHTPLGDMGRGIVVVGNIYENPDLMETS
jgi:uncharacterized phage protein (TIGR01671 family)